MKLSVLVTFCKQKEFIKQALDSIVNQITNFDFEVLVGLDGYDPDSEETIKQYIENYPYIKLFKCDNSKIETISIEKASNNRTNLLKNASGEYFCLLDGDDFYTDMNRFQKLIDILDRDKTLIGCAHGIQNYDHKKRTYKLLKLYSQKTTTISTQKYLSTKTNISSNVCIFRNIFDKSIPSDFPQKFFNDSTITFYMLKYGKIYYLPEYMMAYRTNVESIFQNDSYNKRKIVHLLAGEINHKVIPVYEKELCKRYKKLLIKCLFIGITNKGNYNVEQIKKFAQENSCYFVENILNYSELSNSQKIELYLNIIRYLIKNKYPKKYKTAELFYFDGRSNFGDCLNLYIIQRLLDYNVKKAHRTKATLSAIGSILEGFLFKKLQLPIILNRKTVNIWGSGFIEAPNTKKHPIQKFSRKTNIIAIRGELSKQRCESMLNTKLNDIALGDPGLLANKLISTEKISKNGKVGVILHYVDKNSEYLKNINLPEYKLIDIEDHPIKVLKEIAECKVIFSSAMHGLIAADSLGIPNQWIQLSEKVYGQNYKFKDYYSVFGVKNPQPIDLRKTQINAETVKLVLSEYQQKISPQKVKQIQNSLLESFKNYKES